MEYLEYYIGAFIVTVLFYLGLFLLVGILGSTAEKEGNNINKDRPSTPCPPFVSISIPNNKNIIKK
jgi:hypothetical protein